MFETITVRDRDTFSRSLDVGLLAETLLFYGQIHLLLDQGSLTALLKTVGPDHLQYLFDNGFAKGVFYRQNLCVIRRNGFHEFGFAEVTGTTGGNKLKNNKEKIQYIFEKALGKSFATRKAANRFLGSVHVKKLSDVGKHEGGIPELTLKDLEDPDYVFEAIDITLGELVPTLQLRKPWRFKIHQTDQGFIIDTDLDFSAINSEILKYVPREDIRISSGFLIESLLQARVDLCLSSANQSAIAATPATSKIMQIKFANLLEKRFRNVSEIELFQDIYLRNAFAIREALNSGEKQFADFIPILEKSTRFKGWLKNVEPDESLVREYYKAVTNDTWVEKLPAKGIRFAFFTGTGMLIDLAVPTGLGTALGLSIGAGDAFILDRLIKGWKPNQFVDGPLTTFIKD